MAEPALKVATEFVRIAVANFDVSWTPAVEVTLSARGLNLTDLHNALTCCQVQRSNKSEANGVFLDLSGSTTEDVELAIRVWIDPDRHLFFVEKVS
jgi:hypothetical protein